MEYADSSGTKYSYRHILVGAFVGLLLSFGMIPPTIVERLFVALAFMAIFSFFSAWIIFWLNRCETSRQRRVLWIVLAALSPVLFYGFLLGGLLGIVGVFAGLFLPVFVVLPLTVCILRRTWRLLSLSLGVLVVLVPLVMYASSRQMSPLVVEDALSFSIVPTS